MKPAEHPLLLTPELVRAVLRDVDPKTQTRRPLSAKNTLIDGRGNPGLFSRLDGSRAYVDPGPSPAGNRGPYLNAPHADSDQWSRVYPRVAVGDVLWVRERARLVGLGRHREVLIRYEADGAERWVAWPERLALPMLDRCIANGVHREGARIRLEVLAVRPERPRDISAEDARAEGRDTPAAFHATYSAIYGAAVLDQWAWAYTFRRQPSGGAG